MSGFGGPIVWLRIARTGWGRAGGLFRFRRLGDASLSGATRTSLGALAWG